MAKFKLVIGHKSGKTKQIEVEENNAKPFLGLKIGDKIKGEAFSDMTGYEFQITGGSNSAGFPMRFDVNLAGKKKILLVEGVGIRKNTPGRRVRRTVAGNTLNADTAQINLKVVKEGKAPLFAEAAEEKKE
ncbi:MAG TPA: S6e family ribosomal protein [Acidobacteriota bacterium]|nr:S6e family ribosomal protein [Acidobacteriota bacterium]